MVKALVNSSWELFDIDELQPGTSVFNFEAGLYETIRTRDHRPILLTPHLDRLFNSAKSTDLKPPFHRKKVESMIIQVIESSPEPDQRVRVLLVPDKVIVYTMPLDLDYDIYNGVSVITVQAKRDTPEIKTTNYHSCLNAYQLAQEHECFDAILMDENQVVFEGSRSNLFWIKKGSLFTKETGVLPGVTRNTIIPHSPYAVEYGELNVLDFDWLSELFLRNSCSGIVPIVKVNNSIIGNGVPGPITKELMKLYDSWAFDI